MKILYVASEAAPFVKTGGLADVAGSLPVQLRKMGEDVRVVLPLYRSVLEKFHDKLKKIAEFHVDLNWRRQYCGIFEAEYEGVPYYFLDNKQYFDREACYGYADDGERFVFFSKAVTELMRVIHFQADIVHTNDWHCALVGAYLADFKRGDAFYHGMKNVFTIHNLKYQGIFPKSLLTTVAGLDDIFYNEDTMKYYDCVNFMKGGITFSDAFTTVSESYAEEITYPYYGEHLEGVINRYHFKMHGILNGIDTNVWNPETDPHIYEKYSLKDFYAGKKKNKRELQKWLRLPEKEVPMIAMITRLVENKGIPLVRHIFDELIQANVQFVLIGTGDREYEDSFHYFEWRYPEKVRSLIYYDETVAHRLYASADLFLMPSHMEPCGISQMIAMRYGTPAVVRETGGLRDTVKSYEPSTGKGDGFTFANINAHDMLYTIRRALYFHEQPKEWEKVVTNAMKKDFSWTKSAEKYKALYKSLLDA